MTTAQITTTKPTTTKTTKTTTTKTTSTSTTTAIPLCSGIDSGNQEFIEIHFDSINLVNPTSTENQLEMIKQTSNYANMIIYGAFNVQITCGEVNYYYSYYKIIIVIILPSLSTTSALIYL